MTPRQLMSRRFWHIIFTNYAGRWQSSPSRWTRRFVGARGHVLAAWREEWLAGFAALKQLDTDHGEVKSMRAAPFARGSGVGRAMLAHVIAEARTRGYRRLSLETGTAALHDPAVALYRRAGFVPCDAFAEYWPSPYNQFFTLGL